jgi:predicted RNA polymerase sigma factor
MKQTKEKDCRGNALYEIFRTTASRRKVRFDEPPEHIQFKQADRILRNTQKRSEAEAGREKLKASNKVPTRAGKKLFEDFMKDCGRVANKTSSTKSRETMKNIYNASQHLEFDKWLLFVSEMV